MTFRVSNSFLDFLENLIYYLYCKRSFLKKGEQCQKVRDGTPSPTVASTIS